MKLDQLELIGEWLGVKSKNIPITGFAFDSREIKPGYLFFALKGNKVDGHDFLDQAAQKGAVAAIVDHSYQCQSAGLELLRVPRVIEALQLLAREVQKRRKQQVIAITGSVGKTTTKEFIATLLSFKFRVCKTPGNSNSQVGFPLAILNSLGEEEILVAEMGMSYLHEIEKLVSIAPPDIAVITKIGYCHVDTVPGGLKGIARAKSEILSSARTQWAILEADAAKYPPIVQSHVKHRLTYGVQPAVADVVLNSSNMVQDREELSPCFKMTFKETHFRENFVAAVAVARVMGLTWQEIGEGVGHLSSIQSRFEKKMINGTLFINDSYNANPDSMKAALDNLPEAGYGGKTIAVLGEMSTLGDYSDEKHKEIGEIAVQKVDHALCFGKRSWPIVERFTKAGKPAHLFTDFADLKKSLKELCKQGDVVLIKGSNSNQLWRLFDE